MDEPMRMVTKLNRKSLRALEKSGHHNVLGKIQQVSGVGSQCPSMCHMATENAREDSEKKDQPTDERGKRCVK